MSETGGEKPRTLYDKVLQAHIVHERPDGTLLMYIGTYSLLLGVWNYIEIRLTSTSTQTDI
jgi:hypothetical protein